MRAFRPHPARAAIAFAAVAALALLAAAAPRARAEWMEPDPRYRETQMLLRIAVRDTIGHGQDAARLDTLGARLLLLAKLDDAAKVYGRAAGIDPHDAEALAALGKIALFRDHVTQAESLLVLAGEQEGAPEDLVAAYLRAGEFGKAADLAETLGEEGRAALLRAMAEKPMRFVSGPEVARVGYVRAVPVPLIRLKINGQSFLMAIDSGTSDVLLDPSTVRLANIRTLPQQRTEFWTGSRVAVKNAIVQRLEVGGMKLENVPAGVLPLHKWSLDVNPLGEAVGGVIGYSVLRQFTPTIDAIGHQLVLRKPGVPFTPRGDAQRVPFEIWGASEITVYGSLNGGRRMALVLQTGVPQLGVGAPSEVFDEIGVKPGMLSRITKGAGQYLQGRPWSAVIVPSVLIGPVAADRVQGWSGAFDSAELWRHGARRDAMLGGDFFRDRRLTFDWPKHELIVEE